MEDVCKNMLMIGQAVVKSRPY